MLCYAMLSCVSSASASPSPSPLCLLLGLHFSRVYKLGPLQSQWSPTKTESLFTEIHFVDWHDLLLPCPSGSLRPNPW
jgi:hypothetical protein